MLHPVTGFELFLCLDLLLLIQYFHAIWIFYVSFLHIVIAFVYAHWSHLKLGQESSVGISKHFSADCSINASTSLSTIQDESFSAPSTYSAAFSSFIDVAACSSLARASCGSSLALSPCFQCLASYQRRTTSVSQNTHIRAYKPQLIVALRFNKINNLN